MASGPEIMEDDMYRPHNFNIKHLVKNRKYITDRGGNRLRLGLDSLAIFGDLPHRVFMGQPPACERLSRIGLRNRGNTATTSRAMATR